MTLSVLRTLCSRHFTFSDLVECGATWRRLDGAGHGVTNLPTQAATWIAIAELSQNILDPLLDHYGSVDLTYGFAGPSLTRHIRSGIAPLLDQHAGCERRAGGLPVCDRLGQACDLRVPGIGSFEVARWIYDHLSFDRLYLYGDHRPLHVSYGPDRSANVCAMIRRGEHVVPRKLRFAEWEHLASLFAGTG